MVPVLPTVLTSCLTAVAMGGTVCLAPGLYDVGAASWDRRAVSGGISPLGTRLGSAIAWTGSRLVVWSGAVFERFNPTPADGAAVALAP